MLYVCEKCFDSGLHECVSVLNVDCFDSRLHECVSLLTVDCFDSRLHQCVSLLNADLFDSGPIVLRVQGCGDAVLCVP